MGSGPHLAVHVGFCPSDVVVMVDDHGATEHVQILHYILLGVCQRGDLRVVAWRREGPCGCGRLGAPCETPLRGSHSPQLLTARSWAPHWELPWAIGNCCRQGCPSPRGQREASSANGDSKAQPLLQLGRTLRGPPSSRTAMKAAGS